MQLDLHKYTLDIKQPVNSYKETELEPALEEVKINRTVLGTVGFNVPVNTF